MLTDLEMPRMNGLKLMAHLRSNKETAITPIVMLASKLSLKHKQEADRLRVTSCISKPIDEEELLENYQLTTTGGSCNSIEMSVNIFAYKLCRINVNYMII